MRYKYFGAHTSYGEDIELKRLGQEVELSDELALTVANGGGLILPAELFDAVGFTDQEISFYGTPKASAKAPHGFLVKKEKALAAFREYWSAPHVPAQAGLPFENSEE